MNTKKINLFLVSVCCSVWILAQPLRVASYNIRNDNAGDAAVGNGWKQRCPVVTQLIEFHDFDVFGAQEVLHGQLKDMLNAMPEYAYIGVGRDDGKEKGEYAPVFYKKERFSLIDSGHFWLAEVTDKPAKGWDAVLPRICTWAKLKDKKSGKTFWFFNLHMDHVGVAARLESSKLVLSKIKTMSGKQPVILAGDFNVDQYNEAYKLLNSSDRLEDSYNLAKIRYAQNGTFNSFDPNLTTESRIDHIFVSSEFNVLRYGVLTDTYRSALKDNEEIKSANFPKEVSLHKNVARLPSDHFPVFVQLEFLK